MPPSAAPNLQSIYSFHSPALNDYAHSTIEASITTLFDGKRYDPTTIADQTTQLNKKVVELLARACGNFKYVSTAIVTENVGGGKEGERDFVVDTCCCWSAETDDVVDVVWKSEEMSVAVQLFATLI